ncbi:MAG TPA: class I SAM-dependent methyltransferase [Chloroflexota bacterium]|nr:class I SAM-dependent methyltransferase [Chloroflexota bacterium]
MNFDRAADIYDATRGLPPGIPEQIAGRIEEIVNAGPETRFLEMGVGTGRIALPLIARGYPYVGVDISHRMLERLKAKAGGAPNLTVIEGSITDLPLPDDSVDVVLVIHVFHLFPEWRTALDEALRVLRPGGHFLWGGNDRAPEDPGTQIRRTWSAAVRDLGANLRARYGDWEAISAEVTARGGYTAMYEVARWQGELVPAEVMETIRSGAFSASWDQPREVMEEAHRRVTAWGEGYYGDLTAPQVSSESFTIFAARFPG